MPATQTLIRIQKDGQVTLPSEVWERLGLKAGDLVVAEEPPEGVLLTSRAVAAIHALTEIGDALREQGLTLEDMIERGRDIRGRLVREMYGLTDDPSCR